MTQIENLYAYNNDVPGEPTHFEVQGIVTVPHAGIEPVLVEPSARQKDGLEVLELKLVATEGMALQVVTQKNVFFRREGGTSCKFLEIIHDGRSQRVEISHRQAYD